MLPLEGVSHIDSMVVGGGTVILEAMNMVEIPLQLLWRSKAPLSIV